MSKRDFPEIKICGCDVCRQCLFNDDKLIDTFQNDGMYSSLENVIYLTECAAKSPFEKNINTINHEYLHWVMDKLFPDQKYIGLCVTDEYCKPKEIEEGYHHIPDTDLWKSVEISLGHRYKDFRNQRWSPVDFDVWDGIISSAFNWMNMMDARRWFR